MWAVYRTGRSIELYLLQGIRWYRNKLLPFHMNPIKTKRPKQKATFCVLICVDQYSNMPSSRDYQQYQTCYCQSVALCLMKIIHYLRYPACDLLYESLLVFLCCSKFLRFVQELFLWDYSILVIRKYCILMQQNRMPLLSNDICFAAPKTPTHICAHLSI